MVLRRLALVDFALLVDEDASWRRVALCFLVAFVGASAAGSSRRVAVRRPELLALAFAGRAVAPLLLALRLALLLALAFFGRAVELLAALRLALVEPFVPRELAPVSLELPARRVPESRALRPEPVRPVEPLALRLCPSVRRAIGAALSRFKMNGQRSTEFISRKKRVSMDPLESPQQAGLCFGSE